MYKNILIPTDGSELSAKAVQEGVALAKAVGAKVTAMTVTPPTNVISLPMGVTVGAPADYREQVRQNAAKILATVVDRAKAVGVPSETVVAEQEQVYQAIIDTARSKGCDLIVMASHGRRGTAAVLLGSETVKVLTHSTVPVLVHR